MEGPMIIWFFDSRKRIKASFIDGPITKAYSFRHRYLRFSQNEKQKENSNKDT